MGRSNGRWTARLTGRTFFIGVFHGENLVGIRGSIETIRVGRPQRLHVASPLLVSDHALRLAGQGRGLRSEAADKRIEMSG